mmetsp:Transcript_12472/g.17115  ORF Transcript_12472/g.17115 Transcript_12472/m.17115 type:complete len:505 (+) Transcript_12472:3-1517(+)
MIYLLEYRSLVLEQLSYEAEETFKKTIEHIDGEFDSKGIIYGVVLSCLIIRDFEGFGLHHVSSDGQSVFKLILEVAVANYPEQQYRCHLVNLPWFFNSVWFILKNMLDKRILNKLTMSGSKSDYMKKLLLDVDMHSIPAKLGGHYTGYNTPYEFNLGPDGPFHSASTINVDNIDTEGTSSVASYSERDVGNITIQPSYSNVSATSDLILTDDFATWDEGSVNPLLQSTEVDDGGASIKAASDSAERTIKKRSKSFKMKSILRLFSPSTSSKSQPQPQESPSGRSDMDATITTLPSDSSTAEAPAEPEDLSPTRRFLRHHNDSSSVDTSSPSQMTSHSHRHHHSSSSRASSRASRRPLVGEEEVPSERRRSSGRRSLAQSVANTNNNHAGNTVTVGGLGRDRLSSRREVADTTHHSAAEEASSVRSQPEKDRQRPRDRRLRSSSSRMSSAPRPGESIEQWKTRVNYSSAAAAAASSADLHRQCYSCFAAIDTGEAADMGTSWFCF